MSDRMIDEESVIQDTGDSSLGTSVEVVDNEARPKELKSLFHELSFLLVTTMSVASASIATGGFQISLIRVSNAFNVSGGVLTWAVGSVSLGTGAFLLIMGGIADSLGRKKSILAAYTCFTVFNLIAGFQKSFVPLVIFRALMGVFVSAGTPSAAGLIGAIYKPGKRKNAALACFSAGAPLGFVFGIVVGGICSQFLSWRAVHFFLAIMYGVLTPLAFYVIPDDPELNWKESWKILKALDYVGALLSIIGFTLICFALTQVGATSLGWKTPYILVCLILGVALIVVLCLWEAYLAKHPIMPMSMWKSINFSLAMVCMCFNWLNFLGVLVYYSILFFQDVRQYSPIHTTACVLPMGVAGIMVNIFAALTLHVIPGRIIMITASVSFLVAAILWATMGFGRSYWSGPFLGYILSVVGADLAYNIANMVTLTSVPDEMKSSAAGVFNTVLQLSSTIGLGISSAVVSARNPAFGTPHQLDDRRQLFDGFKNAWLFAVGCGVVSLISSIFLKVGVSGDKAEQEAEKRVDYSEEEIMEENKQLE